MTPRKRGQHKGYNPWRAGPALKTRKAHATWAEIESARKREKEETNGRG